MTSEELDIQELNIEELNLDDFDINNVDEYRNNILSVSLNNDNYNDNDNLEVNDNNIDDDNYRKMYINVKSLNNEAINNEVINNEDINNEAINNEAINNEDINNGEYIDIDECDNIIYSYPFFSLEGIDYEYRVNIIDNLFTLDSVKCDDNKLDFDDCVELIERIYEGDVESTLQMILKNIDLRDKNNILIEGIVDFTFDDVSKEDLLIKVKNNKIYVLFELYKEILSNIYDL